jgi:hypothetical protein
MKEIFVARHPTQAHFVQGLLESEGIPAETRDEALFGARGEAPADVFPSIWVTDHHAARAREILRDFPKSADEASPGREWRCPNCGETLEAQFATCWNCGAGRTGSD